MTHRTAVSGLSIASAALLILGGCDAPAGPEVAQVVATGESIRGGPVSKPFRARFLTAGQGLRPDLSCGDFPWLLNTQVGEGVATHLGRFSVHITFCMNVADVLDDGQLTEGESLPYVDGIGTLVAANGDELQIEISGTVVPTEHPDFDFEFRDPFQVIGGTGRFAGATGEGTTVSRVNQAADRTLHDWRGTLHMNRVGRARGLRTSIPGR